MKEYLKGKVFEIVWVAGWVFLILKYSIDKITIRCEPCIDVNNCPPCQTDFMGNFWTYVAIFNVIVLAGMIFTKIYGSRHAKNLDR